MAEKINILFFNLDQAGVGYYRTIIPAKQLHASYNDEFNVEINSNVNWMDDQYLSKFHIIHFHGTLIDHNQMHLLYTKLHQMGIKTIMDIDDYWQLPNHHPMYFGFNRDKTSLKIIANLQGANYVTTTTDFLAKEIKKYNKNVEIHPNAINPEEDQWQSKKNITTDKATFGILCGSSHLQDLKLLDGVTNLLYNDDKTKNKYKFYLCGYDLRGEITHTDINPEFIKAMQAMNLWRQDKINELQKVKFDLTKVRLPAQIVEAFKNNVFINTPRKIEPKESVWYLYEKILTGNNHQFIDDKNYVNFLHYFADTKYANINDQTFERVFTKPINEFGKGYNNFNVGLAPLANINSPFVKSKSNLKIIENGFHKNAIIVSEVECYKELTHGKNGLIVEEKKQKDWAKFIKKLIIEPNMVEDLSNNLYEYVKDKYDIRITIKERRDFYKRILE